MYLEDFRFLNIPTSYTPVVFDRHELWIKNTNIKMEN